MMSAAWGCSRRGAWTWRSSAQRPRPQEQLEQQSVRGEAAGEPEDDLGAITTAVAGCLI